MAASNQREEHANALMLTRTIGVASDRELRDLFFV
jgi:hypothetical protein